MQNVPEIPTLSAVPTPALPCLDPEEPPTGGEQRLMASPPSPPTILSNEDFLPTLLRDKPEDKYTLIWLCTQDEARKESHYFLDPREATAFALSKANDYNVYFGLVLSEQAFQQWERIRVEHAAAIFALWMDLDVRGPHHTNTDLPTEAELLEFIQNLPLQPTIIVRTVGGFQSHQA